MEALSGGEETGSSTDGFLKRRLVFITQPSFEWLSDEEEK